MQVRCCSFVGITCLLLCTSVMLSLPQPKVMGAEDSASDESVAKRKAVIKRLIENHAEKIVTIKFVATENFMGREQKSDMESPGVVVSPDGLVLASNSSIAGFLSAQITQAKQQYGSMAGQLPNVQSDTDNFRVILEGDDEELEAKLVARDPDLDLAWIQITQTEKSPFKYVDFNDAGELEVGDSYYTISRMPERFERVPLVSTATVLAEVETPRPLLVGSSTNGGAVFTASGKPTGIVITQAPEEGETGGSMSIDQSTTSTSFILPAPKVIKAMQQAREIAKQAEQAEEEKAKEQDQKAEEDETENQEELEE